MSSKADIGCRNIPRHDLRAALFDIAMYAHGTSAAACGPCGDRAVEADSRGRDRHVGTALDADIPVGRLRNVSLYLLRDIAAHRLEYVAHDRGKEVAFAVRHHIAAGKYHDRGT